MDYKHFIYDTITEFTGQNNTLSISVTFIDFVDDLETGLFLSQVIYWADRTKRSDGYFYKTDDEWNQEIKLSKYSVRKARKKLEEMGLLETVVKKANGNPTVHYKFDKDKFTQLFISFLRNRKNESSESQNGTFENEQSLTEITTENTTEITTYKKNSPKQVYDESFISFQLANQLFQRILENNPNHKKPNLQKWADDMRLMMERDKRTEEQIKYLIDWCQQDSFWKSNILSASKLREKFDQLTIQVKSRKGGEQTGQNAGNFTQTPRAGRFQYDSEPPPIDWKQR